MTQIENPDDAAEPLRVLSDAETVAEFSGWGPEGGARTPGFGKVTLAKILEELEPTLGALKDGSGLDEGLRLLGNPDLFVGLVMHPIPIEILKGREIGRDRNGDPIRLILTESPPCQSFWTEGRLVDRARLEALPGWIRIERDLALEEMRLPPVVALPKPDRPNGRGRTSIPDPGERKAQLAQRAERLRRRRAARHREG